MSAATQPNSLPPAISIIAADWGKEAKKRSAYVATASSGWKICRKDPGAAGWSLPALVSEARRLRDDTGTAVVVGIDAVIGVPAAYAGALGERSFFDCLRRLQRSGGLVDEALAARAWNPERPFFRVPAGVGSLTRIIEGAGGRGSVFRQIELLTGAKPVFALSGIPGTVGSGSRALWRELVAQLDDDRRDFRIWPFEGDLERLTADSGIIVAEIYPLAAYATALEPRLPSPVLKIAKTQRIAREKALARLTAAAWVAEHGVVLRDLDAALESEDDFDALVTAAALVRTVVEQMPVSCAILDPHVEGGILPTGMVSLEQRTRAGSRGSTVARSLAAELGDIPVGRSTRETEWAVADVLDDDAIASSSTRRPAHVVGDDGVGRPDAAGLRCPIDGCDKIFRIGRLGWDAHVASAKSHARWHPEASDRQRRKELFRQIFRSWFADKDGR